MQLIDMQHDATRKPVRSLDDAFARCRDLGMRLSKQRRYILELLWSQREHLSAREIYDRLTQQGKDIGHTSVYQNLEALSGHQVIECVDRADGRLYGSVSDSHSHVNCLDTDQIMDVFVQLPEDLIQRVEQQLGVKITDYRIDFFGYSQDAKSQDEDRKGRKLEIAQMDSMDLEARPSPTR